MHRVMRISGKGRPAILLLAALLATCGSAAWGQAGGEGADARVGLPEDSGDRAARSEKSGGDDDSGDRLWERFAALEQAQGRFRQQILDESGSLLERSAGRYAVMKPGFFRWEIDDPDRQQIVVADGVLWHYDIDLASVSRREIGDDRAFTALDLLARDAQELASRFLVERLDEQRYRLQPSFGGAAFSAVELTWNGDALVNMVVLQRGGQRLVLALEPDRSAPPLSPGDFDFEPPDGIDLQADAVF